MPRFERKKPEPIFIDDNPPEETIVEAPRPKPEPIMTPPPYLVKQGDKCGDIIIVRIFGRGRVRYDAPAGRLMIENETTVWIGHRQLPDYKFVSSTEFKHLVCLSSGSPRVIGLNVELFKKGIYALA